MSEGAEIVTRYLQAFYSGDMAGAETVVAPDLSFEGPFVKVGDRSAFFRSAAPLAAIVRGHRLLRQWADDGEVCSIFDLTLESPLGRAVVSMAEWHTVRGARAVRQCGLSRGPAGRAAQRKTRVNWRVARRAPDDDWARAMAPLRAELRALLPHARLGARRRGRPARGPAAGLARAPVARGAATFARLAIPNRDQRLPRRVGAAPAPPAGAGRRSGRRSGGAHRAGHRRRRLARTAARRLAPRRGRRLAGHLHAERECGAGVDRSATGARTSTR
jgi:hypothetical protein